VICPYSRDRNYRGRPYKQGGGPSETRYAGAVLSATQGIDLRHDLVGCPVSKADPHPTTVSVLGSRKKTISTSSRSRRLTGLDHDARLCLLVVIWNIGLQPLIMSCGPLGLTSISIFHIFNSSKSEFLSSLFGPLLASDYIWGRKVAFLINNGTMTQWANEGADDALAAPPSMLVRNQCCIQSETIYDLR
jgi:hypothetical protein